MKRMKRLTSGMIESMPPCEPSETPLHRKKKRVVPELVPIDQSASSLWSSMDQIAPRKPSSSSRKRLSAKTSARSSQNKPLDELQITPLLHYGSEEEDLSDEEDEGRRMISVPRGERMFLEDEVEPSSMIVVEWSPQPVVHDTPSPVTPSSPREVGPSDKFKFDWEAFPMSEKDNHSRRETFTQENTGPTVSFASPYETFVAIWDREIMEMIARETNIYAQQLATSMLVKGTIQPDSRITRWRDTDVNELYTYFAIVLATGVVVKSRLEEYWGRTQDVFSTPGFTVEMPLRRFQLLSRCLHFNNSNNCDLALLTRSQAKLFKIEPLLDHLNGKFSQLYNMSQNVALDESLTMWKGWLDINQFIQNKAATVGVKTYEVCESQTGYLWRFEVHASHDTSATQEDPLSGIIPTLVLRLLKGLEHRGHTIWMDNFYNSPSLARELKVRGFDCVGTLRTDRRFVPSELAAVSVNDMAVGQVIGCTSGDVDLILWRDKKRVAFISTYHGLTSTLCGDIVKPTVVVDYNTCMGGVDKKDQLLAMYPVERKRTKVWYKKLFKRLLNASVLNSYILYRNENLSHRNFRKRLITALLSAHSTSAPTSMTITPKSLHVPAQYDIITTGKSDRKRRLCLVCKTRTTTYCKTCNVAMCVFTCFEPYHISDKFKKTYTDP